MTALLGIKLGMTRIFDANGRSIPVTAIEAGPCYVTQCKTKENDGYQAIQISFGMSKHPKKPQVGHTKMLNSAPLHLREFRLEGEHSYTTGQLLDCSTFSIGDQVKMTATSKGKGFAGVIKRHNFHRGPETHGSDHHRAPGSIGSMFPQHVLRGQKMPGKMGNDQVTISHVKIIDIDPTQNLLFVKGPVPGVRGGLVELFAE